MVHNIENIFDTDCIYYKKLLELYEKNEHFEKKIIHGRHLHHKFLRSFSKKLKEEVDNDPDNLVSLLPSDHFLAHYYIWKSAKTHFRASAARAILLMYRKTLKYCTDDVIELIASEYEKDCIKNLRKDLKLSDETKQKLREKHTGTKWKDQRNYEERKEKASERMKRDGAKFARMKTKESEIASHKKRLETWYKKSKKERDEINYKKGKTLRNKTYEEAFGKEKAKELKRKRSEEKKDFHFSDESKLKMKISSTKYLYKCVETGEIFELFSLIKKLGLKSPNSIRRAVVEKGTCRKLHWEAILKEDVPDYEKYFKE